MMLASSPRCSASTCWTPGKGEHWRRDVANAPAGIAPEHWHRLFDRYCRADQAHQRRVPGVGLGLSLARDIAGAHGGSLTLACAGTQQVCFRLALPAA